MVGSIRFIFWDQISENISSLNNLNAQDIILIPELSEFTSSIPHHKKKLAFILASMREFAAHLRAKGLNVKYVKLSDKENTGTLLGEISRAVHELNTNSFIFTKPSEYAVYQNLLNICRSLSLEYEIREDDRFLSNSSEFSDWANGKRQLRMEFFYREMRRKHGILLDDKENPFGGSWNYDKENRKPPKSSMKSPKRISHKKSDILQEVLELVGDNFSSNFGNLLPFNYAVTTEQANIELDDFINNILPLFGDYQDAMVEGEPYLYHSLLSSYLNIGLLDPLDVCRKAEKAYADGIAPLNAVEGFIRQILGWREYIRGIYWLLMPKYAEMNFLEASRPMPEFYWTGKTDMKCIAEAVNHTIKHAYSHHIQRLMLTGNFALLAGIDVSEVQKWYLSVYSDAFEWVEMPNTLGMALFGDGGIVASKPYAASGKYIDKMSNYCKSCKYSPEKTIEQDACPFNSLYWNFISRNYNKLKNNQRLGYVFSTYAKFSEDKKISINLKAEEIFCKISLREI